MAEYVACMEGVGMHTKFLVTECEGTRKSECIIL
jgi:hypothetical protein